VIKATESPDFKEGKSGGYRSIILFFGKGERAFLLSMVFAKNVLENIDKADVRGFKKLAKVDGFRPTDPQSGELCWKKGEIEEVRS